MNGAAFNKDYCQGQRDNKRELCGATHNMTGQISDMEVVEMMLQQDEHVFLNGQTGLES